MSNFIFIITIFIALIIGHLIGFYVGYDTGFNTGVTKTLGKMQEVFERKYGVKKH